MFECKRPGTDIEDALKRDNGFLDAIRYSCIHWADHVSADAASESRSEWFSEDGVVSVFLGEHMLHWLEALSLPKSASSAIVSLRKLIGDAEHAGQDQCDSHSEPPEKASLIILQDALRFAIYYIYCVRDYPIQIYTCAPVFTVVASPIRHRLNLQQMAPEWLSDLPEPRKNWPSCLREIRNDFSSFFMTPSGNKMVSGGRRATMARVWDTLTGQSIQTFTALSSTLRLLESVAFSPDEELFALLFAEDSAPTIAYIASIVTGEVVSLQTDFKLQQTHLTSLVFSQDGKQLFAGIDEENVRVPNLPGMGLIIRWQSATSTYRSLDGWTSAIGSVLCWDRSANRGLLDSTLGFSQCGTLAAISVSETATMSSIEVRDVLSGRRKPIGFWCFEGPR